MRTGDNAHTFDELVVALYSCTQDAYWSGDAWALLSTAAWSPASMGHTFAAVRYRSPEDQGDWPRDWEFYAKHGSIGSIRGQWYIVEGELRQKTPEMLEIDRKDLAALRRAGLWPKDERTD